MARMPRSVTYAIEIRNAISELVADSLSELNANAHGNSWWTPSRLLQAAALMSWDDGKTLRERFEHVRSVLGAMVPGEAIPASYTGFAQALCRSIEPMLQAVTPRLQRLIKQLARDRWLTHGWVVFAADGSRFESPRTANNERGLKCAGKNRTAPQVFQTTLQHVGTNAMWDFRLGPGIASERRHLEEMLPGLPPGSLITADAGFSGFEFYHRLNAAGVKFLLRVGGNVTLKSLWKLTDLEVHGDEVWVWPNHNVSQPPVRLRLVQVVQKGRPVYLVTNILDAAELNAAAASEIYRRRWGIEVMYRSIKQTLDRATWLSRTAATVLAEHRATILGFWLLQIKSLLELKAARKPPHRWSPAASRRATRRALRHFQASPSPGALSWSAQLRQAVKDEYRRQHPKQARSWPHKKHEPPIRPPRIERLTKARKKLGELLLQNTA